MTMRQPWQFGAIGNLAKAEALHTDDEKAQLWAKVVLARASEIDAYVCFACFDVFADGHAMVCPHELREYQLFPIKRKLQP